MQRTTDIIRHVLRFGAWIGLGAIVVVLALVTMLPKVSDYRTVAITGRSMTETMPIGSLAVVAPQADTDVRVGDVITYDHPVTGDRVTHRVTKVSVGADGRPVFRTKGDHNAQTDPWRVQYVDGTAWKVGAHAPLLGRIVLELQTPTARMLLVGLPALVLLLGTLRSIWATPNRPTTVARTGVRA